MNCQGAMATSLVEYLDWGFGIQFQQHMWYMGNQIVVRNHTFLFLVGTQLSKNCPSGYVPRPHCRAGRFPEVYLEHDVCVIDTDGLACRLRKSPPIRFRITRRRCKPVFEHSWWQLRLLRFKRVQEEWFLK